MALMFTILLEDTIKVKIKINLINFMKKVTKEGDHVGMENIKIMHINNM